MITTYSRVPEEALHQLIPGQLGHVLPADEDELILGCHSNTVEPPSTFRSPFDWDFALAPALRVRRLLN